MKKLLNSAHFKRILSLAVVFALGIQGTFVSSAAETEKVVFDFEDGVKPETFGDRSNPAITYNADYVISGTKSLLLTLNEYPQFGIKAADRGEFYGDGFTFDLHKGIIISKIDLLFKNEAGEEYRKTIINNWVQLGTSVEILYKDHNLTEVETVDLIGFYFEIPKSDSAQELLAIDNIKVINPKKAVIPGVVFDFEDGVKPETFGDRSNPAITDDADYVISGSKSLLLTLNEYPQFGIKANRGDFNGDGFEFEFKGEVTISKFKLVFKDAAGNQTDKIVREWFVLNSDFAINYADCNLTDEDKINLVGFLMEIEKPDSNVKLASIDNIMVINPKTAAVPGMVFDFEDGVKPETFGDRSNPAITYNADYVISGTKSLLLTLDDYPQFGIKANRGDFNGDGFEFEFKGEVTISRFKLVFKDAEGNQTDKIVREWFILTSGLTINYADYNLTDEEKMNLVGFYMEIEKPDSDVKLASIDNIMVINPKVYADGDINKDDTVDIRDLVRLKKILVSASDETVDLAFDLTKDGNVNSEDLIMLRKILLEKF